MCQMQMHKDVRREVEGRSSISLSTTSPSRSAAWRLAGGGTALRGGRTSRARALSAEV
jgi:hypothetical protein